MNVTVNEALFPAGMLTGNEIPLTLNSELPRFAEVTVTLEPAAVKLADWLALVPTTTLLKFNAAGDTVSCPAAVPVPDNGMVKFPTEAVERIETFPVAAPVDCGV